MDSIFLDLGFGTWVWDLDLGLGFGTWICDLDLGLDLGLTIFSLVSIRAAFGKNTHTQTI